jgi:hypothetical protein
MMWINATRIRDQASLNLASCKSACAIGAMRSTLYADFEADVHGHAFRAESMRLAHGV